AAMRWSHSPIWRRGTREMTATRLIAHLLDWYESSCAMLLCCRVGARVSGQRARLALGRVCLQATRLACPHSTGTEWTEEWRQLPRPPPSHQGHRALESRR